MTKVRSAMGYLATVVGLALLPVGGLIVSSEGTSVEQAMGHSAVAAGGVLTVAGHRLLTARRAPKTRDDAAV